MTKAEQDVAFMNALWWIFCASSVFFACNFVASTWLEARALDVAAAQAECACALAPAE